MPTMDSNRPLEGFTMTSPWDADDMMRRSLLSSIMGLRPKKRTRANSTSTAPPSSTGCSSSSSAPPAPAPPPPVVVCERSQMDIYREIVNECELIERSTTASPLSDFSCPTSPLHHPNYPLSPLSAQPPPYSLAAPMPTAYPFSPMPMQAMSPTLSVASPVPLASPVHVLSPPPPPYIGTQPARPEQVLSALNTQVTLEEFVKLVVTAVKEAGHQQPGEETPEEVLRRKRQQNNEAAARYRKRQREAKEMAEGEMSVLETRNRELKEAVDRMQTEIDQLREAVLGKKTVDA